MIEEKFASYFKAEVRNAGVQFVMKDEVFLRGSDTELEAFVGRSTKAKVLFRSLSIAAKNFTAHCSCPVSQKKNQLCKHIWAALLLAESKYPDFFESKEIIESRDVIEPGNEMSLDSRSEKSEKQSAFSDRQIDYKKKQAEYRKLAYQVQKERLKNMKLKKSKLAVDLPEDIEKAIKYFEVNGFPMATPFDQETINQAKRTLSKVFHPDKGGSQEEMLELMDFANVLIQYSEL